MPAPRGFQGLDKKMINHPNRSKVAQNYRYIAFSMITGDALVFAATPEKALAAAAAHQNIGTDFLEVRDCGTEGEKIIKSNLTLSKVDRKHPVVFRGTGYPHLEAVAL